MRRAVLILLAAALPGVGFAQSLSDDRLAPQSRVDLVGEAPSACVLAPPTAGASANAVLQQTGDRSSEVRITRLVDPQTLQPQAASISLAFPLVCNAAHRLIVRTARGGLTLDTPAPAASGFRDHVSYTVAADWAGMSAEGASDSKRPVDIRLNDGAAGVVSVNIQIRGGGEPLVAGPYSDSVIVELQPAS
jgi:hypothetical protein